MTLSEIARRRLVAQHLTEPRLERPREVVSRLGAVQAQDYAGAKWAVAQRLRSGTDADLERAMTDGAILRTHVLRPTWHFVAPEDLRWMLALTAPRVNAACASMYRKLELDDAVFRRSRAALAGALEGDRQRTRAELKEVFERAGIAASDPQRCGYLLMRAELEGVLCSGARRGNRFTYALLEERVPPAELPERDEALLRLTVRYFATRGPATRHDFAWWSGLTMTDVRRGVAIAAGALERHVVEGRELFSDGSTLPPRQGPPAAHLLPNFDEYFIGLKDRSAALQLLEPSRRFELGALAAHVVFVNGQAVGGWKRTLKRDRVLVELSPRMRLGAEEQRAVAATTARYGAFLGLPVELA